MGKNIVKFQRKLVRLGIAALIGSAPAWAGVAAPGQVNVNVNTSTVEQTQVNQVVNDVVLESLWRIVGQTQLLTPKGKAIPPKFWEIEMTVSDSEFATALADVKAQLELLNNVPRGRTTYTTVQDEQTGQVLDQVTQTYEQVQTGQTADFQENVDAGGAVYGSDYIGDPDNYLTWIAISSNDVNVDVNQVVTVTNLVDGITTNTYNQLAVWQVSTTRTITPLLLDMDGDGAIQASSGQWLPHNTLDRKRMAFFDFHGDKFPVLMEWPGPQDGILCQPKDDGSIDGTRLFGTASGFENGFEALRVKDLNKNGKIQGEELNGLSVWTDTNSDARPQSGEVKSLASEGITELSLNHKKFVASYVQNGKSQKMFDWWPLSYELNRVKVIPKKV